MTPNLLILGGTSEATALARHLAEHTDLQATMSLAGRVAQPKTQDVPLRVGGFGGVDGLADYLKSQRITHVIDATHPFAAQMSHNAVFACAQTKVPLVALTRAPWRAAPGDSWTHVRDIPAAVAALAGPAQRVFLAVGRMHLAAFAPNPQHHYLLRLVDAPTKPVPLPKATIVLDRGPFDVEADLALLRAHGIERVVSKNAGGDGARAKLIAARQLGLPVLMIDRPALPNREERHDVAGVMDWLAHSS